MSAGRARPGGSRAEPASAVPDVLGPRLRVVFCGINPGFVSAAAAAHFANPRNDFWRLLAEAGITSQLYEPGEQFEVLGEGVGLTNAAARTTGGSSDLRRADFAGAAERLGRIASELHPRAIAFVGKEAYRGTFGERAEHGPQRRTLGDTGLFVLPSTSPANAAVPWEERLRCFRELRDWLEPVERPAARALVLDRNDRVLLVQFRDEQGQIWWATPGGGIDEGESAEDAIRRELAEEVGLRAFELGPEVWQREHVFAWAGQILHQRERIFLVRVDDHDPSPTVDLAAEQVHEVRWWTLAELETTGETLVPARLAYYLRQLLQEGPPATPFDTRV
ncbi:MAG: NUDIX domain-containing protein [Actinobacteria bacterium]|nr:MAG: NUDIX domain-containing protein [Actinomycetota bacterium]